MVGGLLVSSGSRPDVDPTGLPALDVQLKHLLGPGGLACFGLPGYPPGLQEVKVPDEDSELNTFCREVIDDIDSHWWSFWFFLSDQQPLLVSKRKYQAPIGHTLPLSVQGSV